MMILLLLLLLVTVPSFSQDEGTDEYGYEDEYLAEGYYDDEYTDETVDQGDAVSEEEPSEAPIEDSSESVLPELPLIPSIDIMVIPQEDPNQIYTSSQQIPDLTAMIPLNQKLHNTVWVTSDLKRGEDLYVFFKKDRQGVALAKRGAATPIPQQLYPMRQIDKKNDTGIFIITSEKTVLYYSFKLISPFFLGVSPGFKSPELLEKYTLEDYFQKGYILQLVY